jgi:cell fate regulator YaaT (PSP1 superfamily)
LFIRRGADKFLAFPIFVFAAEGKELFFDGLKKLEQRNHKRVELRVEYVE